MFIFLSFCFTRAILIVSTNGYLSSTHTNNTNQFSIYPECPETAVIKCALVAISAEASW